MQNFQVNLQGIIQLLSKNLYSSEEVFVRELLQNAVDAITARRVEEADFQPRIQVTHVDGDEPQIVFSDNGIGLTEEEVTEFLATIGSSTKRASVANRQDFIGQFGIGLLSCFMISDELVMTTQSVKADYALKWTGRQDGTYTTERMEALSTPGTSVYLTLTKRWQEVFTPQRVEELLTEYGTFLPHPIVFEKPGTTGETTINASFPLFSGVNDESEEDLILYGQRVFGEEFMAAIPLVLPSGQTTGVAYIRNRASLGQSQSNRVYLKGMLLSDSIDNLLPQWAYFIRAIVNSRVLTPTASRERLYQDGVLKKTRKQLGRMIRNWLIKLVKTDPERAQDIIIQHQKSLKEMAEQDREFLKIMAPYLPFPTTQGSMTIGQIKEREPIIEHVFDDEEYKQIRYLCGSMDRVVVHTRFNNDHKLMVELEEVYPELSFREVGVSDFLRQLEDVPEQVAAEADVFLAEANHVLQDMQCSLLLKQFEPKHIPTLYYLPEEARRLRQMSSYQPPKDQAWGKVHLALTGMFGGPQAVLCLNYHNDLIRKLIKLSDTQLRGILLRFLYIQAILLGNYTLSDQELEQFGQGLAELIDNQ